MIVSIGLFRGPQRPRAIPFPSEHPCAPIAEGGNVFTLVQPHLCQCPDLPGSDYEENDMVVIINGRMQELHLQDNAIYMEMTLLKTLCLV
jgi:hypothetical protein